MAEGIPDLFLDTINVLSDSAWGGIAVAVLILIPALGFIGRAIRRRRASDLTCDELKLLKSFNEVAKGKPGAYLSVELAAYRAEVEQVRHQGAAPQRPGLPARLQHQGGLPRPSSRLDHRQRGAASPEVAIGSAQRTLALILIRGSGRRSVA